MWKNATALGLALLWPTTLSAGALTVVGVLEDRSGFSGEAGKAPARRFELWPAFVKDDAGWRVGSMAIVAKLGWPDGTRRLEACFDGKSKGDVGIRALAKGQDAKEAFDVPATPAPPSVGTPSEEFADMAGRGKVLRPLVVTSQPQGCSDPARWHRDTGKAPAESALIRILEAKMPLRYRPATDKEGVPERYALKVRRLRILKRYVAGADASRIIHVGFTDSYGFGGNAVLVQRADAKLELLGEDMQLLDAGDYDRDGTSEVIFKRWGECEILEECPADGYVLAFDDLRRTLAVERPRF